MTTSGSYDYTLTANQIIDAMFNKLGVGSEGEALTARHYEDGRRVLNLLVKKWGAAEHLWTETEGSVILIADQQSYALATLFSVKPMRVLSVRRKVTSGGNETPLNEMSRQEYFDTPNKSQSSTPNSFYYDPQRTTGTLYLWPPANTATAAAQTLNVSYLRRMADFDGASDEADMPQEWLDALIWNGADSLEVEYPVNDQRIASKITAYALDSFAALKGWDHEPASVFLQPDYRGY